MPGYLAPGVHVEETSFRARSIPGASTSTTAFVGVTARGPRGFGTDAAALPLPTSVADFERCQGSVDPLRIGGAPRSNHMALAVRAFFANGGGRLYLAHIFADTATAATSGEALGTTVRLAGRVPGGGTTPGRPGVSFETTIRQGEVATTKANALRKAPGTTVRLWADYFVLSTDPPETSAGSPDAFDAAGAAVSLVTVAVEVMDGNGTVFEAADLGLHPRHVGLRLGGALPGGGDALANPVRLEIDDGVSAFDLRAALAGADGAGRTAALTGGSDGDAMPGAVTCQQALATLAALEDASVVPAPTAR